MGRIHSFTALTDLHVTSTSPRDAPKPGPSRPSKINSPCTQFCGFGGGSMRRTVWLAGMVGVLATAALTPNLVGQISCDSHNGEITLPAMSPSWKVAVGPGQINLIEDTTGKGHITRNLGFGGSHRDHDPSSGSGVRRSYPSIRYERKTHDDVGQNALDWDFGERVPY